MIGKLARIAQLLGEILELYEALAKYYPALYSNASLSLHGIKLGQSYELNCTMHYWWYNNPACEVTGGNINLVVYKDGRASIYRKDGLGWLGIWKKEEVERILETLKINENVLDNIINYLSNEIEWLRTKLAETILLS
jgi:hypothetical protein